MHKEAGRPWPVICPEDPVVDYMVMEAVAMKVHREDSEEREKAEQKAEVEEKVKAAHDNLRKFT